MADISHISIPSFNIDGDIKDTTARTTINNHIADKNNPHNVTKVQVGLGNVDNTSDMDKPISTAVQNALDKKADNKLATESSPGLMSAEDKKAIDREFFKLVPRGATYVPYGADLRDDQYFKVGTYYHDWKPSEEKTEESIIYGMPGAGLYESPLAGEPFIMYVMSPLSDKYDDESTANEMTLQRLRIMIVGEGGGGGIAEPGKGGGPIWIEWAFNRYGKDSEGIELEEGGNWFTSDWDAIAIDIDLNFLKQYMDRHIYSKSNPHNVTKDQVGLGNVDNTADKDKSVNHANTAGYADMAQRAGNAGYADTANHVSWGNVSGKPSTYPPSSHIHTPAEVGLDNVDNTADKDKSVKYAESAGTANSVAWDNVTDKPTTMASSVAWDDVTNKPSTYPPSSHTHTPDQVGLGNVDNTADKDKSVKYAESAGSVDSVAWDNITDKPSSYPPTTHTHTPDQVGLGNVANLDQSKAIKSITRSGTTFTATALDGTTTTFTQQDADTTSIAWENVTDKPSTYPPDAHTHTPSEVGLGNVDNTADKDKPISTAVQKALDGKASNSVATSSTDGLMSKSDKAKLDSIEAGSNVESVNGKTGVVNLTKADIGLGNVDNTADKDKSVKYADTAGSVDSVAWENVTDKPSTYTPATHTHTKAQVGLGNVDNTADKDKPVSTPVQNALNNKVAKNNTTDTIGLLNSLTAEETTPTDADYYISQHAGGGTTTTTYHRRPMSALWAFIKSKCDSIYATVSALNAHISNKSNPHGVTKAQVGLGNVDNTSDANKPISTAVQKALDGKANNFVATSSTDGLMSKSDKAKLDGLKAGGNVDSVNGKTGAVTLTKADVGLGNVDNTADKDKSVKYADSAGSAGTASSVAWGNVSGKPSTYPPSSHTHTPAQVGLGNVDNTSDANKPISTAVQKALDGKANNSVATSSTDGLMSAADKKAVDREFFKLVPKGGTYIPANADFNTIEYIKVGNYYNASIAQSETIKNIPVGSAFIMYVLAPLSEAYDNESTDVWVYRLRIFITYNGLIFTQLVSSDVTPGMFTYGPWVKITNAYELGAVSDTVNSHISNKSNPHGVTKAQVGLGNVDNTADSTKSVNYATSAGSANSVAWGNVSGKPSSLPANGGNSSTVNGHTINSDVPAGAVFTDHTYNFDGVWFTSGNNSAGVHDANAMTHNGTYYYSSNGPSGLGESTIDGALYSQAYSDIWVGQIAQDYRNGNLFTRGKNNGTWQPWKAVAYKNEKATNAGYADSAGSATKATQDSSGQQINSTYIKNLSVSGRTITYTRGNGTTGTITTQDTNTTYDILNSVYPVGSIYMSMTYKSPASFLGGTWQQIFEKFLFASGSNRSYYNIGDTGGEFEHKLTMDEVIQYGMWISDPAAKYNSQIDLNFNAGSTYGIRTYNHDAVSHNNMPPYLVVYMWKRTA